MSGASCMFTSGCLTISSTLQGPEPIKVGVGTTRHLWISGAMGETDIESKRTDNVILKRHLHEGKVQFAVKDLESLL